MDEKGSADGASGGPRGPEVRRGAPEVVDLGRLHARAGRGGRSASTRIPVADLSAAAGAAAREVRRRSVRPIDLSRLDDVGPEVGSSPGSARVVAIGALSADGAAQLGDSAESSPPRVAAIDALTRSPAGRADRSGAAGQHGKRHSGKRQSGEPGRPARRGTWNQGKGSSVPSDGPGADLLPTERVDLPAAETTPRTPRSASRVQRLQRPPASEAEQIAEAKEICLRLLTDRARARQELDQALRRRGTAPEIVGQVLDRFDEVGLIDDEAFAAAWTRSRHRSRGLARRAISQELRRKGIAKEVADTALAEVDDAAEESRARELVDKRLCTLRMDTAEERAKGGRRLVGMLARKGYPSGVAYRVVRAALAEHGADEEELGSADTD